MQTISLNASFFSRCKLFTGFVSRRGGMKKCRDEIYKACVFIYSKPGSLVYFGTDGYRMLEISEPYAGWDFGRNPFAIDAYNLPGYFRKSETDENGRIDFEIPDCTWANFQAFQDKARPKWLKAEDINTFRVCVGGKASNLVYMTRSPNYEPIMNWPKTDKAFGEFSWNKSSFWDEKHKCDYERGCRKAESGLRSCDFDDDFQLVRPAFGEKFREWDNQRNFYVNPLFPDSVHLFRKEESETPLAKWERTDKSGCRIRMVIMGRTRLK